MEVMIRPEVVAVAHQSERVLAFVIPAVSDFVVVMAVMVKWY
jgi:hypothetical protein